MDKIIGFTKASYAWYFKEGKYKWLSIIIFLEVMLVLASSLLYAFQGAVFMFKLGGPIIFLMGAGIMFSVFPIFMAVKYSTYPARKYKKLNTETKSEGQKYMNVLIFTLLYRLLIWIVFSGYQYIIMSIKI